MAEAAVQKQPTPIRAVSRAAAALADAVEDSLAAAKRIGTGTSDAAEQLMDDTSQRIKRHPVETVVGIFAAGVMLGAFLGWLTHRR
jgi:F0F1-type ATP synthase assembly protein I